jgi:DNA mismatch endonuclease (patch repair protein)
MKSNKSSSTSPELILSRRLRKRIRQNLLPGRPDFVFKHEKVAVFVHGCFWHRCPIHGTVLPKRHRGFWRRKFRRNVERDALNRLELKSMGWKVIEVWEHEVVQNPAAAALRVRRTVNSARTGLRLKSQTGQ